MLEFEVFEITRPEWSERRSASENGGRQAGCRGPRRSRNNAAGMERATERERIWRPPGAVQGSPPIKKRRHDRAVEGGGLENHCTGNRTGASNPSPSSSLRSRLPN